MKVTKIRLQLVGLQALQLRLGLEEFLLLAAQFVGEQLIAFAGRRVPHRQAARDAVVGVENFVFHARPPANTEHW